MLNPFQKSSPSRFAVFTAGDINILFPALIALKSIRENNLIHPLDLFIIFPLQDLTEDISEELRKRGIHYVPSEAIREHGSIDDLPLMNEGRWPKEVFDNWAAPNYFANAGYEYAIKVDYDLLCIGHYALDELMPSGSPIAGCVFPVHLKNQGVTQHALESLSLGPETPLENNPYINVGFVSFNCHLYRETGFFDTFKKYYSALSSLDTPVANCEQAAISLMCSSNVTSIKNIAPSYNVRITLLPKIDLSSDGPSARVKNLHYLTANKPWLPADFKYLDRYAEIGRTSVYLYRQIWLNFASKDPLFDTFVTFDCSDQKELSNLLYMFQAHLNK